MINKIILLVDQCNAADGRVRRQYCAVQDFRSRYHGKVLRRVRSAEEMGSSQSLLAAAKSMKW